MTLFRRGFTIILLTGGGIVKQEGVVIRLWGGWNKPFWEGVKF